ncbi:hypothetical protein CKA55_05345 [Arcobacter suis]|uniref:KAP NTPase domain-containing protein n=1 Tax=Arcobacter suis CECT 7833 TaxID=663365 RepID=A0AAD0SUN9_9BACT|nr:P-loop NTPase fold protein [Arcobacter suis]AXX90828.1 hypothetical protein ASUIS_2413 [Arcobacter suis CECT 7833]RWS47034.1 hypothetical protein CKA55_05345 [Arcobacter suis]
MSNQQKLENYLVGTNGYLKSDISNGKVIMLSGKWGSGKTHFWKNIIATEIFEKELKEKRKSYAYISLYGKNTIESIQNDLLYNSYEFIANPNEKVSKFFSVFTYYSQYSPEKISSGIIKGITDLKNKFEFKKAESYLSDGGVICFDDFERKSKNIDLNDLFGFITQLTQNFNCKVVIILNDDVFEGEEKKIFSNVKEKSVSKFLKYEPSIRDLFKSIIFEKDNSNNFKYSKLKKYLKIILKTIEETQELNARIYIQVLDNLVEWIISETKESKIDMYIRYLIKLNINFIINHKVIKLEFKDKFTSSSNSFKNQEISMVIESVKRESSYQKDFNIKKLGIDSKVLSEEEIKSIYFSIKLHCCYFESMDIKVINKINNFIESGILINE